MATWLFYILQECMDSEEIYHICRLDTFYPARYSNKWNCGSEDNICEWNKGLMYIFIKTTLAAVCNSVMVHQMSNTLTYCNLLTKESDLDCASSTQISKDHTPNIRNNTTTHASQRLWSIYLNMKINSSKCEVKVKLQIAMQLLFFLNLIKYLNF
jgi:hypothetical protein